MMGWIPKSKAGHGLKVLCLGAHSDDIEIGCGATVLKLAGAFQPLELRWEVFSGEGTRADEARASAQWWMQDTEGGTVHLHDFRDGFFPAQWPEIKACFERLKEFDPDLIFTHFRNDLHQDHRIVSELTWNTFRNHSILEYEVPKYDGDLGVPNFYIPCAMETVEAKVDALMRYFESQRQKPWFTPELFYGLMRVRGMEANAESGYAEAFHSRKTVMD